MGRLIKKKIRGRLTIENMDLSDHEFLKKLLRDWLDQEAGDQNSYGLQLAHIEDEAYNAVLTKYIL